jgi:hypothetical protein
MVVKCKGALLLSFFSLLSLPMIINLHFTWRQYLAQLIVVIIFIKFSRISFIARSIISLGFHPFAFLSVPFDAKDRSYSLILVAIYSFVGLCSGYIFSNFTALGYGPRYNVFSFTDVRVFLWSCILFLYFLPVLFVDKIFVRGFIFIIFFSWLGFVYGDVTLTGYSRFVSFFAMSCVFLVFSFGRKILKLYLSTLSGVSFFAYLVLGI